MNCVHWHWLLRVRSIGRTQWVPLSGMGVRGNMHWEDDKTPIKRFRRPFLCGEQQQVGAVGGHAERPALTKMQRWEMNRRFMTVTNYFPFILKPLLQLMGSFLFQISVWYLLNSQTRCRWIYLNLAKILLRRRGRKPGGIGDRKEVGGTAHVWCYICSLNGRCYLLWPHFWTAALFFLVFSRKLEKNQILNRCSKAWTTGREERKAGCSYYCLSLLLGARD